MDSEDASTIYVAKNKSPLLIGLGDGYNMVCSDAMAMIRETNQFMEIHDQELVIVRKDSVEVCAARGSALPFRASRGALCLPACADRAA